MATVMDEPPPPAVVAGEGGGGRIRWGGGFGGGRDLLLWWQVRKGGWAEGREGRPAHLSVLSPLIRPRPRAGMDGKCGT